jgi:parallel beta-helix repeat protein
MIGVLCFSILRFSHPPTSSRIPTLASESNVLVNGDFETGTFEGWNATGVCTISNTVVHGGLYSAYISDEVYDSFTTQELMLPANKSIRFEGWFYPFKVGSIGDAYAASSRICFIFYNVPTMRLAFIVTCCWCWNDYSYSDNSSGGLEFLLPFNASAWNCLSLDLSHEIWSYYSNTDFSNIILYSVSIYYHYSNGSPGTFYVDDLKILTSVHALVSGESWLSGWEYRKSHTIESVLGAGQNYQIEITVINGTGIDSGYKVYVNNKTRSDFGDIRFTRCDGVTLLSYWIETKNDQRSATFWVKISDDLDTSNVTIYVYYGAPDAMTTSNIDSTFAFGDDFECDLSKWSIILGDCETRTDYAYEGSRCLKVGIGSSHVANLVDWSNVAIHVWYYDREAPGMEEHLLFGDPNVGGARAGVSEDIDLTHYIYQIGMSYHVSSLLRTVGWHSLVVRCCASDEEIVIDGNVQPYTAAVNVVNAVALGSSWVTNGEVGYFDALFVCKYVNPEPQHGAWGNEEHMIIVPDDYSTIQAAIDAASDGDTVFVRNGTYYENVVVDKAVSLIGERQNTTIIDGEVNITADYSNIKGFTVQNNVGGEGIILSNLDGCIICDVTVSCSSDGFYLDWVRDTSIINSTVLDCQDASAIHLEDSGGISITGCIINTYYGGILFEFGCSGNILSNCTISNNRWGIAIGPASTINTVINNNIVSNQVGISLEYNNWNRIFHNNFINNSLQVHTIESQGNTWDNGYPSGGNYWSGYTGVDLFSGPYQNETGSDGIGDSPYAIDANNTDNYPLMQPYPAHNVAVNTVTAAPTIVCQGYGCLIAASVVNKGDDAESFNVTIYANFTATGSVMAITTFEDFTLNSRDTKLLLFMWDTSGFALGNYIISGYATPVSGEISIADNTFVGNTVQIIQGMTGGGGGLMPHCY